MKKKILFSFLILSAFYKGQSNLGEQPKQLVPFPTSAETYSLSKIEKIPMDYFRGKANISIPIYNISIGGISIPISLSYNTGGIKLNEVSSSVGLGWSLNIPGNISHNMIGLDDLSSPFFSKNMADYGAYSGLYDEQASNNQMRINLASLYDNLYDTKKDIFDYNLPTASGSFLLKDNNQTFLIPNDDVIITRNGSKFYVKDTQGTEYWLSPRNTAESMYIGGSSSHVSLYNLDSVKVNNNVVQFSYYKGNMYTERNINQVANFKITPNLSGNFEQLPPFPKYEKTESTSGFSESLISKIQFDGGEVTFLYSNDANNAFSDGLTYRKDLNNNNTGIALRRIIVTNRSGSTIKDITLNYSYFESNRANKTYEDYRLKLINVHDNLQNSDYRFEYNEQLNLPKRNTSNDDYWGYINATNNNEGTNIPNNISVEYGIPADVLNAVQKRDREPNETYAILGSLKSIQYPTGAKKNFEYELPYNTEKQSTGYTWGHVEIGNIEMDESGDPISIAQTFPITAAHMQQIANIPGAQPEKLEVIFNNICDNANNSGHNNEIEPGDETSCTGTARYKDNFFSHFNPKQVDWNITGPAPITLTLDRLGACRCSMYTSIRYRYPTYTENTKKFGSLRLRKMEDVDENNISNVYQYAYGKYENGTFIPDFSLNQPYNFSSVIQRYVREFMQLGTTGSVQIGSALEKYYRIHNSSQAGSSYGSSDIMTYPSVVEITGKGKIIREFDNNADLNYMYNKWKRGNLKREIYLNQNNDTLRIVNNTYKLNTLKNSLSEFTTAIPEVVAFSTDFNITKGSKQVLQTPVDIYYVDHLMYLIESAKVEKDKTETTEYFNGKKITSKTKYEYYDTDINKPINIKSKKSISPDETFNETSYSYAYEKGNQLMIDKNMIGIPLETTSNQTIGTTTKMLAKTETLYPKTTAEIINNSNGLILPLSIKSYDIPSNSSSTEVTYNKYDSKGNILQYTPKDSNSPVAIVWGYKETMPIAKIEGITYNQLANLGIISGIVSASDADAANPSQEGALLTAFTNFKNNSSLNGLKITTYTYDPLIGVTNIIPPTGIRQVYIYDSANRLKEIRENDAAGKILKEFKYNYKN
ncbi:hypothetical protein [Chryseobacterium sp. ERMR1:04]|uniref:hypothetical protein n=1 Tax=Chryseobacterium sp. ERMR1:04 TaxID=1705393 RepID=UPI0006C8C0C0|nr:hypothetical protein [Chryseobacterium sp. ERMR1:04]KPH14979.1 hypothetical protein AMQ68_06100 [Chryseobacterium sp. ERMR1:04]